MVARLLDHRGEPIRDQSRLSTDERRNRVWERAARILQGSYDAAQTTSENANHWAAADSLSAAAANSPSVRKTLRERSRYEINNNSYLKGMVLTLANATIGTGPRLQLKTEDAGLNAFIEREFHQWCDEILFADKLRTSEMATVGDGESGVMRTHNWRLETPVKADLKVIECDQVATPYIDIDPDAIDGLVLGDDGYVDGYHLLKRHPGDLTGWTLDSDIVSFRDFVHVFREDRPGQRRGIPETTPALPLFAMLRRFVLAVLAAAETAADFSAIMYTDSNAIEGEDIPNLDPSEGMPIDRRMFQVLPLGWKMAQLKAEQPTTTFGEFRAAIINEAARCLLMPFNIATGNSSGYNFASGRLDYHVWENAVHLRQYNRQRTLCKRALLWWWEEARRIPGYLPTTVSRSDILNHDWLWPAVTGPIDQSKSANAADTNLSTGLTHRGIELSKMGVDVDEHDEQAARLNGFDSVEAYRKALGARQFNLVTEQTLSRPKRDDDEQIDATLMRYPHRVIV